MKKSSHEQLQRIDEWSPFTNGLLPAYTDVTTHAVISTVYTELLK